MYLDANIANLLGEMSTSAAENGSKNNIGSGTLSSSSSIILMSAPPPNSYAAFCLNWGLMKIVVENSSTAVPPPCHACEVTKYSLSE